LGDPVWHHGGDFLLSIKDFTSVGSRKTGDQVYEGGLPGAIGTDDAQGFTPIQIKGDLANGADATKIFGQFTNLQNRGFVHASTFTHRSN
jgi:hypothetical protein